MPTPVNHLIMAREVVESGRLIPAAQRLLERERGPFLLGHTAADVQTVSGHLRYATHFYTIPPDNEIPAYRVLLATYPELASAARLEPSHVAFVTGYLAHLLADEKWWREIFNVFFGPEVDWRSWRERIFLHNVLRVHLDREDQARLGEDVERVLARAEPLNWLPFVADRYLRRWRDLLVEQLRPEHHIRTAEVFAERMHIPPRMVEEAVGSPQQMACIFQHLPRERLQRYRAEVLQGSVRMINEYLQDAESSSHG